ncbi:serine hydrolase [Winogradskyella sp.]|uniref:serine hydrolase n=1 Tax=Winogradskyella sp. TaxID=1883156 RepID=UPI0026161966|nr:serine hydrolase [Winogradskyella sp.]
MFSSAQSSGLKFSFFLFFVFTFPQVPALNSTSSIMVSNGALAYAYPMDPITVDGDSKDWPIALEKYPIATTPYGELPKKEDFEAYFQVGYNMDERALYLLVTVMDDNHVVDTSENATWITQDSYALYVDYKHKWNGSGVNLFQFGENFKRDYDYTASWDPEIKDFNWDKVTIQMSRNRNTITYEVKIDLGEHLQLNKSVGIDHVLADKDPDDEEGRFSFISWGQNGGKSQSASRLGDVIPVAKGTTISKVSGKLTWEDTTIDEFPDRVTLINKSNPKQWTVAEVDSLGNYTTMLPKGQYLAESFWEFRSGNHIDLKNSKAFFEVKPGTTNQAKDLVLKIRTPLDIIPEKGTIYDFDPKNPSELDNFIATYQEFYVIPGVSLVIIKDGKVVYHKTYGNKNSVTGKAVNNKTLFEAASITKPVFAFAVCRLAEKGIIDLDTPLYTYLPFEDIAHDERYKLITARHVLTHQTGFPNWAWENPDGKIDIKFTPGTGYGYSGEGFEYLKRVVIEITGRKVEDVVKEEVLDPFGIKNTYFTENDYMRTHVANGHYGRFASSANLPDGPGMAWSMHTEAMDFSNFALGLLERKVLNTETYEDMFKVHTVVDDDDLREGWESYFGLGVSMEKTPFGPSFGHGGNNGDFKCLFKMYSELNSGFIVFTNSNRGDYLSEGLEQYLITGKTTN